MRRCAAKVQRRARVSPPDGRTRHSRPQTRFILFSLEVRYFVAEKIEDIVPMVKTAAAKAAVLGMRKETVDPRL
jgi:hypothetical protein